MITKIDWSLSPHDFKWTDINRRLMMRGYWVKWETSFELHQRRYAVGKQDEGVMGIFEGEGVAMVVVKMLLED